LREDEKHLKRENTKKNSKIGKEKIICFVERKSNCVAQKCLEEILVE
jgi:hypothetical protein